MMENMARRLLHRRYKECLPAATKEALRRQKHVTKSEQYKVNETKTIMNPLQCTYVLKHISKVHSMK
jgi:hypothetical protein